MFRSGDEIGPYTLISKLGKGAFGVVWLAERRTRITTTNAAIKIPLDDEINIETIKREADLWVRASGHPNVLPIIEADIYNDYIIIASEYAPDGSLGDWLKKNGKASSAATAEIVSGILAGLEHLHSRNIIHRDLKPANILFQGNTPRLADFGISRVLKSTSQSSNVMGTPSYMAPEAFNGKRNEQTDIWSVGVIFYQLLAGHLPYQGEDLTSLVGAILTGNPKPLPTSVPMLFQNVAARALAKDTNLRYKSATEMRKALLERNNTSEDFQAEKSVYTVKAKPAENSSAADFNSSAVNINLTPHIIYAIAGLLAVLLIVGGLMIISNSNPKEVSNLQSPTPKTSVSITPKNNNPTPKARNNATPEISTGSPVDKIEEVKSPKQSEIFVDAKQMYGVDTNINVSDGEMLSITASGEAVWINVPKANPVKYAASGPNGTPLGSFSAEDYQFARYYLSPKANYGALIGKIGSGDWFQIGASFRKRILKGGRLLLAVNDRKPEYGAGNWADNSGGYSVKINQ